MAIKKEKTLTNGVVADYWKIAREDYNRVTGQITIYLGLFLDAQQTEPVTKYKLFCFEVSEQVMSGDRTAAAYNLVKASGDEDIAGGQDV